VIQSPVERGLSCATQGLDRFGFPQLQMLDVPSHIGVPWAATMAGIALRLIERWFDAVRDGVHREVHDQGVR
jgi:hypothetical protein